MCKFKFGAMVTTKAHGVGVVVNYNSDVYPLAIVYDLECNNFDSLTRDGKLFTASELPVLFKATEENYEMLSKLYGVEFEAPPAKPTPREIIKAYIERDGHCWCGTSDVAESHARADGELCLVKIVAVRSDFHSPDYAWEYAIPFDPETCKEITEMPE